MGLGAFLKGGVMLEASKAAIVACSYLVGLALGILVWRCMQKRVLAGLNYWFGSSGSAERTEIAALTRELAWLKEEAARLVAQPEQAAPSLSEAEAGSLLGGGAAVVAQPFSLTPASQWDRLEFLAQCGNAVTQMSRLLDEHLCDSFEGEGDGERLARALRALLRGAAAWAEGEAAAAAGSGDAASLQSDAAFWGAGAGARVVQPWLATLTSGAAPLCSAAGAAALARPAALAALGKLAALHAQLSLWPAAADASIRWALAGEEAAVDFSAGGADKFLPFSPGGRAVGAGTRVFLAGPSLLARQPLSGGAPADEEQLAELRGLRCLTLVIDKGD